MEADKRSIEIISLTQKLEYLGKIGRYSSLLSRLFSCNDINNFKSFLIEATFAYSFETMNIHLFYETTQANGHDSSVDFLLNLPGGKKIFFEIRVNQQQKQIQDEIANQFRLNNRYAVSMNGIDEQKEIFRLQRNILSKVQDKNGNPVKFCNNEQGVYNIVAVEIIEMILGAVDKGDCMLASYGDSYVEKHKRRGIFGLFQKPKQYYPNYIIELSKKFSIFHKTVHGILFLVRHSISGPLDFSLKYHFIPNMELVSESEAKFLDKNIMNALLPWDDR